MTETYDPQATTVRLRSLSHEDAEALASQLERRRYDRLRAARREVTGYLGLSALGVFQALGLLKLVELLAPGLFGK